MPQISVVTGLSAGGGAYSPALTDWIVMTEESSMFLTGPGVVREALGEVVDAETLGGAKVHQKNGVCHFVAEDDLDASRLARDLLGYLPSHSGEPAPHVRRRPPSGADPESIVPPQQRRVYDVRDVIGSIVDGGELLEISAGWARNLVTGFARIDGRTVGVVANQPRYLGGVLDVASSEKGARFVSKCDTFGIPLLVLEDTPGYMPGVRQESAGVIRAGANFVHAFAQATVPRITVILRKAFGGAFITMNSKDLGADYVFAWPSAEIGIMGAKPAVGVIHRRQLAAAEDPEAERERLATHYAETQLRPGGGGRPRLRGRADRAPGDAGASGVGLQHSGTRAMTAASGDVLLTGATGFVGMELLARYLQRGDRDIITLVRSDSQEGATARIDGVLDNLFGDEAAAYRPRVHAVAADMTAPGLGLTEDERLRLAERVTKIVHSAASVSFTLPLDEARAINLEGTRRMLELAELARAARRPGVLRPHLHRVRRRRSRGDVRRVRHRCRPGASTTPTSSPSSRPSSSCARMTACRTRSCGPASSSAIATTAGPPRSTCSTGRCAHSLAGCSRRCRRSRRPRRRRLDRLRRRRRLRAV